MLNALREKNPHLRFEHLAQLEPLGLGRIVTHSLFEKTRAHLDGIAELPEAVLYEASVPQLEATAEFALAQETVFGGMPIQAGICIGHNRKLNALEWHKGSELLVASTDLVLLLDHVHNVREGRYRSADLRAFFVPAGSAVELFATTLHFAPIETHPSGFRAAIFLPRGTNTPLEPRDVAREPLLFMRNKWLVAHPESPSASRGAHVGIEGANISILLPET